MILLYGRGVQYCTQQDSLFDEESVIKCRNRLSDENIDFVGLNVCLFLFRFERYSTTVATASISLNLTSRFERLCHVYNPEVRKIRASRRTTTNAIAMVFLIDSNSPPPHRLAIVSGPAVVLWDCLEAASVKANSVDDRENKNAEDDHNGDDDDDNYSDIVTSYPHGQHFNLSAVAFNHNSSVLASATSCSDDERPPSHDSIDLMTTSDCSSFRTIQHDGDRTAGRINTLCFGDGSRFLCCGDDKGVVTIWDLKQKRRVRQHIHPGQKPSPSLQVEMDKTNCCILSMTNECIYVYHLKTSKLLGKLVPMNQTRQFTRFHTSATDTNVVCVGTMGGEIFFYDISSFQSQTPSSNGSISSNHGASKKISASLKPYGILPAQHDGPITGLAYFRNDPNKLVTGGADGNVCLWDMSVGKLLWPVCSFKDDAIRSLSLHDDGQILAVGTESGHVRVFEISTLPDRRPRLVSQLEFDGPVEQVLFAPTYRAKRISPSGSSTSSWTSHQENVHALSNTKRQKDQINLKSNNQVIKVDSKAPAAVVFQLEEQDDNDIAHAFSTDSSLVIPQAYSGPSSCTSSPDSKDVPPGYQQQQVQVERQQHQQQRHQPHSKSLEMTASPMSSSTPQRQPEKDRSQQPGIPQHRSNDQTTDPESVAAASTKNIKSDEIPGIVRHEVESAAPAAGTRSIVADEICYIVRNKVERVATADAAARTKSITADDVRDIVRNEVESLGDLLEKQLRDLHLVMMSQFYRQSEDVRKLLSEHMTAITSLQYENRLLRDENERLRHGQQRQDIR